MGYPIGGCCTARIVGYTRALVFVIAVPRVGKPYVTHLLIKWTLGLHTDMGMEPRTPDRNVGVGNLQPTGP